MLDRSEPTHLAAVLCYSDRNRIVLHRPDFLETHPDQAYLSFDRGSGAIVLAA